MFWPSGMLASPAVATRCVVQIEGALQGWPGRTRLLGQERLVPGPRITLVCPGLCNEALKASLWSLNVVGTWRTLKRLSLCKERKLGCLREELYSSKTVKFLAPQSFGSQWKLRTKALAVSWVSLVESQHHWRAGSLPHSPVVVWLEPPTCISVYFLSLQVPT